MSGPVSPDVRLHGILFLPTVAAATTTASVSRVATMATMATMAAMAAVHEEVDRDEPDDE